MSIFTCKPAKDLRANKASIYTHTYIYIEFIGTVVALAVLQCAGDVETPTGGGDDGKAWRQFDPGGSQGRTCGENL